MKWNECLLCRALIDQNNFLGVTGSAGFDLSREAIKQLYLLHIKRGRIVELQ
ncbi:MAG: hypothetical protein KAG93_03010 [Desulfuromusa sp.]|nr:hypothetical protein [Desulfuromusa sp.]